jgi:hypothetical protein
MSDPLPQPAPAVKPTRGFVFHEVIRTGQHDLRWTSVGVVSIIWFAFAFHIFAGGINLAYTVKRYYEDPRIISLITTLNVIIMLGPFISYISDQIWTRIGRRKPLLLIAYGAAAWGMAGLAFLPQATAFLQPMAHALGLPSLTEPILMIAIVVSYTTLYDFTAPMEPLMLECVPPHQRGRFFAIRNVQVQLASLFFFQLLWPIYDYEVPLFAWMGIDAPGLAMSGEQIAYVIAAFLFFMACFVMVFLIEEVKVPSAPNKRVRDLGLWKFIVSYVRDVFLTREAYPFYIMMIIPTLAVQVWGNFDAIMKTDQFEYSKGEMALMGLPPMVLSMVVLTPFAGWYSDIKPVLSNRMLVLIGLGAVACMAAVPPYYAAVAPADIRILPSMAHCFGLSALVSATGIGLFVILTELVSRRSPRIYMRGWIALIAVVKDFITVGGFFIYLQFVAKDGVPPIILWMLFGQFTASMGALIGTAVAPMIFEYIPRSKLGTVLAGKSLLDSVIRFGVANLGAWWVVWWSLHIHTPKHTKYDYSSLYLLQMLLYIPGIIAVAWFLKQILTGKIRPAGILEVEPEAADPNAPAQK